MADLKNIITSGSRIMYDNLKNHIDHTSMTEFTSQITHPFLVGKELYEGEIKHSDDGEVAQDTMKFNAADIRKELLTEQEKTRASFIIESDKKFSVSKTGISSAIFILRKKDFSEDASNVFTIGRNANNDIVIPDYSISKFHATITMFHGRYFIEDLGSTNGIKVNDNQIGVNTKVQLSLNASVAFGRIVFFFSPQLKLYRALKTVKS